MMKTYKINDFEIGEVVYLKYDFTLAMVISTIDENAGLIRCYWRDKTKKTAMYEDFPPSVLSKENDIPPRAIMRIHTI